MLLPKRPDKLNMATVHGTVLKGLQERPAYFYLPVIAGKTPGFVQGFLGQVCDFPFEVCVQTADLVEKLVEK